MGKEKTFNITNEFLISKLAKTTDLRKTQILEVVDLYTVFIANYLKSGTCPANAKITIPHLGNLSFKKRDGVKAGTKCNLPYRFGVETKDKQGNYLKREITIEEDRPDYLRLHMSINPKLQAEIRDVTEENWRKEHGEE